jgi:ATP-dependent Lon protease
VKWIDKVLEVALERHPTPLPDDEGQPAATLPTPRKGADPVPPPVSVKH